MYGNANLTYPVALITLDEVVLAGGKYDAKNENFFLNQNVNYLTMTPMVFSSYYLNASIGLVSFLGSIFNGASLNNNVVRPVINIRSDVLISSGDGSVNNPYILKIN